MKLDDIRNQIDKIDDEISKLYLKRMQLISDVTECKRQSDMPTEDKGREEKILRRITINADGDKKEYLVSLYEKIFQDSKKYQNEQTSCDNNRAEKKEKPRKACLIGENLAYSFSKSIHEKMSTDYCLIELKEDEVENFVKTNDYDFFNVTIPYKQKIMNYLDGVDETAKISGCVNTVVNIDGKKIGYNTDVCGLNYLFTRNGVSVYGKNVVILGTGATSKTACFICEKMQAAKITVVGRREKNNYSNVNELTDTQILINTTPVGTYPDCDEQIVDLRIFPKLEFVADVVYNPLRTRLVYQAEKLGVACSGGLPMLVCQAVKAEQIAYGENACLEGQVIRLDTNEYKEAYQINDVNTTEEIIKEVYGEKENIALVGMPSCGKTIIGKTIAKKLGKRFVDIDEEILKAKGMSASEIILMESEEDFRKIEKEIIFKEASKHGAVIATGGGSVLLSENVAALRQNSFVVYIERKLSLLELKNRPLSARNGLHKIYAERANKYLEACDKIVKNDGKSDITAEEIIKLYEENISNKRT